MQETQALWQFTAQAWLPLSGCVLTLALGLFVWSRKWDSLLHRTFAALNLAAALWNLDVFFLFTVRDRDLAGAVDRLFQIPIVTMPFLGLFFVFVFLGKRLAHPLIGVFGGWTVFLWVVSGRPDYISGWDEYWFGYYGRAGSLYLLLPVTHLAFLTIVCRCLWKEYRATRDYLRRNQVACLLAAHLLFGLLCLDNFGPLYGVHRRLPLGNVATLLYFGVIAGTIARFRLLDAQVIFRYGLLYTSLTFVLSGIYFTCILGLQDWFRLEVFSGSVVLPMVPALGLAFAVGPIKNSLQRRLDRRFFRCRVLMRDCLAGFSSAVKELESERDVWEAAWREGWSMVNPERALVLVRQGRQYRTALSFGVFPDGLPAPAKPFEGSAAAGLSDLPDSPGEKGTFEVRIPVAGKEGILGGCLLGPKKSGGIYTAEDVNFLGGIAGQCGLAVEKVRLLDRSRERERLAVLGKASAVVSHELRNPLSVMRGAMALLRSRITLPEGLSLLSVIENEIRRGDRFIKDFLSACREPRSNLQRLDLVLFVREFVARWDKNDYPDVEIDVDLPAGEIVVPADIFQLNRLLQNLARNAAEAAQGACRLRIRCEAAPGGGAVMSFSDNGPGVDESLLHQLFEPFFTTKRNSTGLGLSIVKGIVDAHRGRIHGENNRGGGATFRVWLPAFAEDSAGRPAVEASADRHTLQSSAKAET